jgi:hypothetical protein
MGKVGFWERPPVAPGDVGPMEAMSLARATLERRGIALLVVPIPFKAAVYWEELAQTPLEAIGRPDIHVRSFFDLLGRRKISVLDLWPTLRAARSGNAPLYLRNHRQLSPRGVGLVAAEIANALQIQSVPKARSGSLYRRREVTLQGGSELDPRTQSPLPEETVTAEVVEGASPGQPKQTISQVSPVLLIGDCALLDYHVKDTVGFAVRDAGLPDQLAYELNRPVDVLARLGAGSRIWSDLLRAPERLEGKKVVVWVFAQYALFSDDAWIGTPAPLTEADSGGDEEDGTIERPPAFPPDSGHPR